MEFGTLEKIKSKFAEHKWESVTKKVIAQINQEEMDEEEVSSYSDEGQQKKEESDDEVQLHYLHLIQDDERKIIDLMDEVIRNDIDEMIYKFKPSLDQINAELAKSNASEIVQEHALDNKECECCRQVNKFLCFCYA